MSKPESLGKYTIIRPLGQGAMGIVYEGYDAEIDRRVAIKTIKPSSFTGSELDQLVARLRREAQAVGRLNHTNITALYEFGVDTGTDPDGTASHTPFLAMEFVEGRELTRYFDEHNPISMPEIKRIMVELLSALEYAHSRGVIHRDIKPSNIVLMKDGTVKLADFGIARLDASTLTQLGSVLGTPCYMAPEQFRGETVDLRADLYSAGILLYQLLAGEVPFDGSITTIMYKVLGEEPRAPSTVNGNLPAGLDAIVLRAIAKEPRDRYQSAAEFKAALSAANFADDATQVRRPAPAEGATTRLLTGAAGNRRFSKRTKWIAAGSVAGAAAIAAVAAALLMRSPGPPVAHANAPVAASAAPAAGAGVEVGAGAAEQVHVESATELEQSFWERIKDSHHAADFTEYQKQFPQGLHAAEAALLVRKLKPRTPAVVASTHSKPVEPAPSLARTPAPALQDESRIPPEQASAQQSLAGPVAGSLGLAIPGTYAAVYRLKTEPGRQFAGRLTLFGSGQFYAIGIRARADGTVNLMREDHVFGSFTMTDFATQRRDPGSVSGQIVRGVLQMYLVTPAEVVAVSADLNRRVN